MVTISCFFFSYLSEDFSLLSKNIQKQNTMHPIKISTVTPTTTILNVCSVYWSQLVELSYHTNFNELVNALPEAHHFHSMIKMPTVNSTSVVSYLVLHLLIPSVQDSVSNRSGMLS